MVKATIDIKKIGPFDKRLKLHMSKPPLPSVGKLAVLPTQEIKKQILESSKTPEL
jgi:hypothetical protein